MNKAELYALDVSIINFLITFLGNTYTLEKCFANKIYFAILKRCIDCCIILFKHFLSNVHDVPCITFLKAMFLHILPSNWQLATFMLLQVDIAKIFSMLQYYMLEINFSFMNVPQLYSYSGLRILQQFLDCEFHMQNLTQYRIQFCI